MDSGFDVTAWVVGALTTAVFALGAMVRKVDVDEIHRRIVKLEELEDRLDAMEKRLDAAERRAGDGR